MTSALAVERFELPVVSAVCDEPSGKVLREVRPMSLALPNLKRMWELSRQFNTLFNEETRGDFRKFLEVFLHQLPSGAIEPNGLFWVIDDFVGMFYMTQIVPDVDANVHYTFFDRRHKGRVQLVREMLKYAFLHYNFQRLSVEIPYYALHGVMPFVEAVGFKSEGRKRSAAFYKGEWYDINLFGILRQEALGAIEDS